MTLRRIAVSLSAVVLLALAGCGGGGDDDSADGASESTSASQSADATESDSTDTEESASSESSDGGGGGGGGADEFCGVFEDFEAIGSDLQAMQAADKVDEIRQFADDLEDAAPDEIAADVATVVKYIRLLADAASGDLSNGDDLSELTTEFPGSIAKVSVWASTNCA